MKLAITLALSLATSASATGFLEPPLTVFGKVTTELGTTIQLYAGEVAWTFTPPPGAGEPFTVSSQMAPVAGGDYSFRVRVPVENVPPGFATSSDKLSSDPLSTGDYTIAATVNGQAATLSPVSPADPTFSEIFRGSFFEIDLSVDPAAFEALDSDADGLPDLYEDQFGLDKNDPDDAFDDGDGDGAPNIVEFYDGTDPTCYDWNRWLADNNLTGELADFDADPDLDGLTNGFEYAFDGDPRTPDRDSVLAALQLSFDSDAGGPFTFFTAILPGNRHCGAEYVVEISSDMSSWAIAQNSATLTITELPTLIELKDYDTDTNFVCVRIFQK